MGGEKYLPCFNADGFVGSPPRGRGKGKFAGVDVPAWRITPAWAGKSAQQQVEMRVIWDHPRVGGEKGKYAPGEACSVGSPPRGRGKAAHPLLAECWHGDHPRVGGEKIKSGGPLDTARGSPPRGRGKVDGPPAQVGRGRITPAQAGKSCSDCRCSNRRWDHPRIGGEKTKLDVFYAASKGSPPRGRGKVYPFRVGPVAVRITPAWAGKSLFCFTAAVPIQDHPRTGGERSGMKGMKSWKLGSPPHRRGKGIQADGAGAWAGITPAQAGKRSGPSCG